VEKDPALGTGQLGGANLLHTSTARAVLFSAITTVASFSTLAVSDHMGIASLAQLLTAGIIFMLLANVIVLPALLSLGFMRENGKE
jgi:predicted RND superfamily exporter protein